MKKHTARLPRPLALTLSVSLAAALFGVTGCGVGIAANPSDSAIALSGLVHGGNQPVQNSTVTVYATTSSGYNGAATTIASTTTDANGNFSFATAPTCAAGQFAYIVSAGGNPGLAAGTNNSAILLMAPLGACSALPANAFITINEVTTVASAYALSGFLTVPNGVPTVTTSATNVQGLTDAFANAANIVNIGNGQAYATTPTGGTVTQATINSIADILQNCVNAGSPSSSSCAGASGSLTQATPPGATAPTNSLQAALDIAQYPGNNVSKLFGLLSTSPAFQPALPAAPNDWTVAITYTSPLLTSGLGLAIDNSDNVYVSGSYQKTPLIDAELIEFNAQGLGGGTDLIGNLSAATHNDRYIAIDKTGNLFLSDGSVTGVYEYVPGNSTATFLDYSKAPASNTDGNNYAVAVDGLGDVWTTSYKKSTCATGSKVCELVEYVKGAATAYQPNALFTNDASPVLSPGIGGARGLAFDVNTGNVWFTDIAESEAVLFPTTPSATAVAAAVANPTTLSLGTGATVPATTQYGAVAVAIDKASNAWVVITGGPTAGNQAAIPAGLYPVSKSGVAGTPALGGGLSTPSYLAIDGNNNIFVANTGAATNPTTGAALGFDSTVVEYSPASASFLSPNVGFNPGGTYAAGTGPVGGSIYSASYLAVDRSGALWVLSGGTGASAASPANLVQILGVAAPTNPVLAAGQYGIKP